MVSKVKVGGNIEKHGSDGHEEFKQLLASDGRQPVETAGLPLNRSPDVSVEG